MIKKKIVQKKSANIIKEDVKKITPDEFDSVMRQVLSAPPQKKKAKKYK